MEEWRIKWLRMSLLRMHTLLRGGFTVRNVSNASFTSKALTKRFIEGAQTLRWVDDIGAKPSKSGRSVETIYRVTDNGRLALIKACSPLHAAMSAGVSVGPPVFFESVEHAESCLSEYLDEQDDDSCLEPKGLELSPLANLKKVIKDCFADYEALKDIDPVSAGQLRARLWNVMQRAEERMKRKTPKSGSLLDYFRGEA